MGYVSARNLICLVAFFVWYFPDLAHACRNDTSFVNSQIENICTVFAEGSQKNFEYDGKIESEVDAIAIKLRAEAALDGTVSGEQFSGLSREVYEREFKSIADCQVDMATRVLEMHTQCGPVTF